MPGDGHGSFFLLTDPVIGDDRHEGDGSSARVANPAHAPESHGKLRGHITSELRQLSVKTVARSTPHHVQTHLLFPPFSLALSLYSVTQSTQSHSLLSQTVYSVSTG